MTDEETVNRVTGCQGRGQCGCDREVDPAGGAIVNPDWEIGSKPTLTIEVTDGIIPRVTSETHYVDYVGRLFEGGAYRDTEEGKLDYEGFFSPAVLKARAEYMHKHRTQSNGEVRDSDNWQAGMPIDVYMKSAWRHFVDWWTRHRDDVLYEDDPAALQEAICALMFNCEGYLHELLKEA